MKSYQIQLVKSDEDRITDDMPEQFYQEERNLKVTDWFEAQTRLRQFKDKKLKKFVKKQLSHVQYDDLNRKYRFNERENFKLVRQGDAKVIFEAELEMPKHLLKRKSSKSIEFGDMRSKKHG